MAKNGTNKSTVAPKVIIAISIAGLLIGVGRCGFLQPAVRPPNDYGISGAFFLFVGLALLIVGLVWLNNRRKACDSQ